MTMGTASETGPEAMAAKRHIVASAKPAPAKSGSQTSPMMTEGKVPLIATHRVRRMSPPMVTPAVVRAGPTKRLVRPAVKSRVPQHRAVRLPRRIGFMRPSSPALLGSSAVRAQEILPRGFEVRCNQFRSTRDITLSQRRKNHAMLPVIELHLGPGEDDLLH